jgi:hypothetical protein
MAAENANNSPMPCHNIPTIKMESCSYVGDASPSVVAIRITECLRKQSIAVEYDDEKVRFFYDCRNKSVLFENY